MNIAKNSTVLMDLTNDASRMVPAKARSTRIGAMAFDRSAGFSKDAQLAAPQSTVAPKKEFSNVYRQMVEANRVARQVAQHAPERPAMARPDPDTASCKGHDVPEREMVVSGKKDSYAASQVPACEQLTDDVSAQPVVPEVSDEQAQQASSIIGVALETVAKLLNLDTLPELAGLELTATPNDDMKDQLTNIIATLNQIAQALAQAAANGELVEVKGDMLTSEQADAAAKVTRVQAFNIQVAVQMLGVSGEVSERLAALMGESVTDGIPVAVDPAQKQMSPIDAKAFFDRLISNADDEVKQILARVKEMSGDQNTSQKAVTHQSVVDVTIVEIDKSVVKSGSLELKALDNPIARALISSKLEVSKDPAELAKSELLSDDGLVAPDKVAGVVGSDKKVVAAQLLKEQDTELTPIGLTAKSTVNNDTLQSASVKTLHQARQFDAPVMHQIIDRMQVMMKAGQHEVKLTLNPESLGQVQIKVQINDDIVVTRIQVESQQVKQIVEANLAQLKDALAQNNLQNGGVEVQVGQGNEEPWAKSDERAHHGSGGNGGGSGSMSGSENDRLFSLGVKTGRYYGNNSIELYV